MSYILTFLALATTIAAALGETYTNARGRRRLTRIGLVVVSAAVITAGVSIVERLNHEHGRARLQSIWMGELQRVVNRATQLQEYILQNAYLETVKGANPHRIYDDKEKQIKTSPRAPNLKLKSSTVRLSWEESTTLLSKFSVNPPRYPWKSWPVPISWRPQNDLTMDDQISRVADDIIQSLENISEDFGEVMTPGERANIEEMRRSPYLLHLASIKHTAADARYREDSNNYPVCILQPGISGAPIADYEKFYKLIEEIKVSMK